MRPSFFCAVAPRANGSDMRRPCLAKTLDLCYEYALLGWRSPMGNCCDKRYSAGHQEKLWNRHGVSQYLGTALGLFALLAMLVSHVVHTVDIPIEAPRPLATFSAALHPHSLGTPAALSTTTAVPPGKVHDPFLCPVCQILSQTHHALVSTGTSIALPRCSATYGPNCTLRHTGTDLAASAPRAPPSLA